MQRSISYNSQKLKKSIKMPYPKQQIQFKKQKLLNFHRQSKTQRKYRDKFNPQENELKKNNDATQSTWRLNQTRESGRGFSHRIKSSGFITKKIIIASTAQRQNGFNSLRPQTTSVLGLINSLRGTSLGDIYPKQILGSMQNNDENRGQDENSLKRKRFLRKGTGVKYSILFNLLKSKINKTVAQSGSNYSGFKHNKNYVEMMKKQIPNQLKDVIGAQQMFRMSNIFTGNNYGFENLYEKVNSLIDQRNELRQIKKSRKKSLNSAQDNDILKHRKRW